MPRSITVLLLMPALLGAQEPLRRGFALVDAAGDTVAIERWIERGERLEVLITRDGWPWFHLLADSDPESGTERLALTSYDPAPEGIAGLSFSNEVVVLASMAIVRDAVSGEITESFPVGAGTIAYFPASLALLERRLQRSGIPPGGTATIKLPVLAVGPTGAIPDTLRLAPIGHDSVATRVRWHDLVVARDSTGQVIGARSTEPAAALHYVPLPGEWHDRPWPPVPTNYLAGRDEPFRTEEVALTVRDGTVLAGTLVVPTGSTPSAAVLLLSGSGAQARDAGLMSGHRPFREVAEALGRAGIATLRLDDRGAGSSSGRLATVTIADLAADARAALAWLGGHPDIDGRRLGILGHSEGALVAMSAAARDASVTLLVLLAGSSRPGSEIVAEQQRYGIARFVRNLPEARRDAVADSLATEARRLIRILASSSPALEYFLDFDPRVVARRLRVPALVLHGESDRQVPVSQAGELADALRARGAAVTVRRFAETNHLFLADADGDPGLYLTLPSRATRPEVLATIVAWVTRQVSEPPP
jgi:hypothetical protein